MQHAESLRRARRATGALRALLWLGAVALLPATATAVNLTLSVRNDFGVAGDVGPYRAFVSVAPGAGAGAYGGRFDCTMGTATVSGTAIAVRVQLTTGEPRAPCEYAMAAAIGELAPARYQVVATVALPEGGATLLTTALDVAPRGALCNVDPFNNRLWFQAGRVSYDDFCTRLAADADYRRTLGDVVCSARDNLRLYLAYPELRDPARTMRAVLASGDVAAVGWDNATFCFAPPPPDVTATAIEYHHGTRDHYFVTADAAEQNAIDAGAVGAGWQRTGKSFTVTVQPGCPQAVEGGFHPIYRFAGIPGRGPDSHFFTATQRECAVVRDRTEWGWGFEGAPFWAEEPHDGACPASRRPLFRVYNAGKGGAANHRYTTDAAVVTGMVAQGWIDEGVAMCL